MSLINKMLQDLDARGGAREDGLQQQAVKAVPQPERDRRSLAAMAGMGVAATVVLALAGWYGWQALQRKAAGPVPQMAPTIPAGARQAPSLAPSLAPSSAPALTPAPAPALGPVPAPSLGPVPAPSLAMPATAPSSAGHDGAGPAPAAGATLEAGAALPRDAGSASSVAPGSARSGAPRRGAGPDALPQDPLAGAAAGSTTDAALATDTVAADAAGTGALRAVRPRSAAPAASQLGALADAAAQGAPAAAAQHGATAAAPEAPRKLRQAAKTGAPVIAAGVELTPKQLSENTYRRALASLQEGRVSTALTDLDRAVEIDPRNEAARQTYVSLLLENRRPDDAIRQLRLALGIDRRQPGLAMVLARLQLERGGPALQTLMTTLPYAATNADYQGLLAGVLQREQRHAEAARYYQAALALAPVNGVWWMGLGISLQADQHRAEAREAFTRARTGNGITPELLAFINRRLEQLQAQQ